MKPEVQFKQLYDRLTFPHHEVHKMKFAFLNNRFNQAGNFFHKIIRRDWSKLYKQDWTPTSPSHDIYFQFMFMYCNMCILIPPGDVFPSTGNVCVCLITKGNRLTILKTTTHITSATLSRLMLSQKCLYGRKVKEIHLADFLS